VALFSQVEVSLNVGEIERAKHHSCPEETQEMGQRARYLAEKRYNLERFTQKRLSVCKA
jgi:hypothetical protein